jgi:hypothetical protein
VKGLAASETGKVQLPDLPRSDCPVTAVSHEMLQCDDAIIPEDGRSITRQLALSLLILKGNVNHIARDLEYWKVCVRWAPRGLTFDHKTARKAVSFELSARFEAEGETLCQIVTANDSWVHFEPEMDASFTRPGFRPTSRFRSSPDNVVKHRKAYAYSHNPFLRLAVNLPAYLWVATGTVH